MFSTRDDIGRAIFFHLGVRTQNIAYRTPVVSSFNGLTRCDTVVFWKAYAIVQVKQSSRKSITKDDSSQSYSVQLEIFKNIKKKKKQILLR